MQLKYEISNSHIKDKHIGHYLRNCPLVNATRPRRWYVDIESGNGLVLSGTIHSLNQCWPRVMSPYYVTRPWWVKYKANQQPSHIAEQFNTCLHIVHIKTLRNTCCNDRNMMFPRIQWLINYVLQIAHKRQLSHTGNWFIQPMTIRGSIISRINDMWLM